MAKRQAAAPKGAKKVSAETEPSLVVPAPTFPVASETRPTTVEAEKPLSKAAKAGNLRFRYYNNETTITVIGRFPAEKRAEFIAEIDKILAKHGQ